MAVRGEGSLFTLVWAPGGDGIATGAMDAPNGVAYEDDSQVVSLCVLKCDRTRNPTRMRVAVSEIGERE